MIFEGSRYEAVTPVRVPVDESTYEFVVYPELVYGVTYDFNFSFYTIAEGDRLDLLAADYYGDSELWWVIARANPEILYPEDLPVGTVIRIPSALSDS